MKRHPCRRAKPRACSVPVEIDCIDSIGQVGREAGREIVQVFHLEAVAEQRFAEMGADETRATGDDGAASLTGDEGSSPEGAGLRAAVHGKCSVGDVHDGPSCGADETADASACVIPGPLPTPGMTHTHPQSKKERE